MAEQARRTSGGSLHTTFVAVAWLAVLSCASAIIAWPNRQIHGRRGVGYLPGDGGQPGDCRRMSGGRAEGVDS